MLHDAIKDFKVVLASGSPRRRQLLEEMGFDFEVRIKSVQETYPSELVGSQISDYLTKLKALAFKGKLDDKEILITADTVVWCNNKSLAKPHNETEAVEMLRTLSNDWHEVITSVCFTTTTAQKIVNATTKVKLAKLSEAEILHYIKTYKPFDKAGGYGIQEWIGLIGIEEIQGSYTNVVGLPTHLVYQTLMAMVR